MSIEIHQVDPADDAAIRDFYEVYLACGRHDSASFIAAPLDELSQVIRQPTSNFRCTAFLARGGGTGVGRAGTPPTSGPTGTRRAGPRVLPPYRRPDISATITSNALTRAAMVKVNDQLGYQVVEYVGEVEKSLAP